MMRNKIDSRTAHLVASSPSKALYPLPNDPLARAPSADVKPHKEHAERGEFVLQRRPGVWNTCALRL